MDCNLENRQNLISRYLSDGLSEDEARTFEEHYFQCEVCFKELRAAEDAINLIENEGKSVLNFGGSTGRTESYNFFGRTFGTPNKMKVNWGIAVSFTIIIIAVLLTTILTKNDHKIYNHNSVAANKDRITDTVQEKSGQESLPEKIPDKELAANLTGPDFTPNKYLEEWSNENVRSINDKLDKVISPIQGVKIYNKDITFQWSMNKNEIVTLKILNNKEKEVYSRLLNRGFPNFTIDVSSNILKHSGLYYWKIEDEDEVLHIGKFYFIKKVPE